MDAVAHAMGPGFPAARVIRVIRRSIQENRLRLDGLTVMTEAATGWYRVTPIIAALAGADRVVAVARDNAFGTVDDAEAQVSDLARAAGCASQITLVAAPAIQHVRGVQVVTNLGAVRPIDADLAGSLGGDAAVSLMFGARDLRSADLDARALRAAGVPLCAVDEDAIGLFRWTGHRIAWWLTELGVEINDSRVAIWGDSPQAHQTAEWLGGAGTEVRRHRGPSPPDEGTLDDLDALVLMRDDVTIAPGGALEPAILAACAPGAAILEYAGRADRAACAEVGLLVYPFAPPSAGHVARTIGEILYRPVIVLHTAGLRVGEILVRRRLAGDPPAECERRACADGPGEPVGGL